MSLLELDDVHVAFRVRGARRSLEAVAGVSLALEEGQTLGLVGESGCGKSTLARAIVGLVRATSGQIRYRGEDVTAQVTREARMARRREIQVIFQDPYLSLNPRRTVGDSIKVVWEIQGGVPKRERDAELARLLERVGLDPRLADRY